MKTETQNQDFVVGGRTGGFSPSEPLSSYDYIVTAKNKREAKKILKQQKSYLRGIYAKPVTEYVALNPYDVFERLEVNSWL